MSKEAKEILLQWYEIVDEGYGEHGDRDSGCPVCSDAVYLGLIEDRIPEEQDS